MLILFFNENSECLMYLGDVCFLLTSLQLIGASGTWMVQRLTFQETSWNIIEKHLMQFPVDFIDYCTFNVTFVYFHSFRPLK